MTGEGQGEEGEGDELEQKGSSERSPPSSSSRLAGCP